MPDAESTGQHAQCWWAPLYPPSTPSTSHASIYSLCLHLYLDFYKVQVFYFHWTGISHSLFHCFPSSWISHHFLLQSSLVTITIHPGVQARTLEPCSIPPFPWPLTSGIPPFLSTSTDITRCQATCMTVIALTYPPSKWPNTQQPNELSKYKPDRTIPSASTYLPVQTQCHAYKAHSSSHLLPHLQSSLSHSAPNTGADLYFLIINSPLTQTFHTHCSLCLEHCGTFSSFRSQRTVTFTERPSLTTHLNCPLIMLHHTILCCPM